MGYSTDFSGQFNVTPTLSDKDCDFLVKFAQTRRMARKFKDNIYGIQGEFYVDGEGDSVKSNDVTVIDYNMPPKTQPGLWCQWIPNDDGTAIVWDEGEKFYGYIEWIQYLIKSILIPRGYTLNGEVKWFGEDSYDRGKILVKNNVVRIFEGKIGYKEVVQ